MRKHYAKLIRDRIPEIMDHAGVTYETRTLSDEEFAAALRSKLVEEAREAAQAPRGQLAKELGGVIEVLHALAEFEGIDLRDVENVRRARAEVRGAFRLRLFLEWTEEPAR